MKIFIALGNIGEEYKNTRHNAGTIILDGMVDSILWQENKYAHSYLASLSVGDHDVLFVKPILFMNESGKVIPFLEKEFSLDVDDLVVIHDDIDLPLGSIKISYDRGDGGHNGVKSIMQTLDSKQFTRIRIGVSIIDSEGILRKPDVLGKFSKEEMGTLQLVTKDIVKICESLVLFGLEKTMSKYN